MSRLSQGSQGRHQETALEQQLKRFERCFLKPTESPTGADDTSLSSSSTTASTVKRASSPLSASSPSTRLSTATKLNFAHTLEDVKRATEEHLQSVAVGDIGFSYGSHHSNHSNRTLVTGHTSGLPKTPKASNTANDTAQVTPIGTRRDHFQSLTNNASVPLNTPAAMNSRPPGRASSKRKKSPPMKVETPTVSDMTQKKQQQQHTSATATALIGTVSSFDSRKRSRVQPSPGLENSRDKVFRKNAAAAKGTRRMVDFFPSSAATQFSDKHNSTHDQPDSDDRETLVTRCQKLELALRDREDEIKAIRNNRTILSSAMEASNKKKDKMIDEMKQSQEDYKQKCCNALEKFVRQNATRDALDLREQLASASTRLGRIVHTRTGMRSMESWEDGYATREIKQLRKKLAIKKAKFEERVNALNSVARLSNENELKLSDLELIESTNLHLKNVREEEKVLLEKEKTLNDEKCAHIRSLKRVANEDASRFQDWPKLNDRYVLVMLLGKGGFSEVWKAYDLFDMTEVAVKIHQLDSRWSEDKKESYTKHVTREYEIHKRVRHERIVSLLDVFEIDDSSFATVLELCNGSDLDALLKEKRRLPEEDARAILLQILFGMSYLCSSDKDRPGIIHYDLKPANILFDEWGDAKITDFGLSKVVESSENTSMELTSQGTGTYWYLPPECFVTENVRISNRVDVWSIGVIFYQMIYGKRPFGDGLSPDKILNDQTILQAHEVRFPDSPSISTGAKDFIRSCLTYDQASRPSIPQICVHEYIVKSNK